MAEPDPATIPAQHPEQAALRWLAYVSAAVLVTAVFIGVIRPFLIALILAAITAALLDPVFRRILRWTGGRRSLTSALTLVFGMAVIMVPLFLVLLIAAGQATLMADSLSLAIDEFATAAPTFTYPNWWPVDYRLYSLGPDAVAKAGEFATSVASFMLGSLSHIAGGTVRFFLDFFVYLYALFAFMQMRQPVAKVMLSYSGLHPDLQHKLWERVVSISRATLKGTIAIGIIQGALGAFGFWVTGLGSPAFWGVVMAVISVIPGVGPPLVLCGGAIALALDGAYLSAVLL
ncbi:MAG: AI-2E family transporter, partial [Rhodobacteraceae bacterium]|nr:AI-2E family transporter [Paracoccaceae bacterium]